MHAGTETSSVVKLPVAADGCGLTKVMQKRVVGGEPAKLGKEAFCALPLCIIKVYYRRLALDGSDWLYGQFW